MAEEETVMYYHVVRLIRLLNRIGAGWGKGKGLKGANFEKNKALGGKICSLSWGTGTLGCLSEVPVH